MGKKEEEGRREGGSAFEEECRKHVCSRALPLRDVSSTTKLQDTLTRFWDAFELYIYSNASHSNPEIVLDTTRWLRFIVPTTSQIGSKIVVCFY